MILAAAHLLAGATLAFAAQRLGLVAPLAVVCLFVLVAIPVAAAKGKLHMPGYSGLSMLLLLVALLFGYIAGRPSVTGHPIGIVFSFLFFVLIAAAIGCILALAFYRRKRLEETEPPQ